MGWIYLIIADIFEVGWPVGFKLSQTTEYKVLWFIFGICSMALSGLFLWLAQKEIPIGTAYAVWTGIGAVGTLLIGMFYFGDSASIWRLISAFLIILGIIGLKLS